jgi:hypothetical protein
MTKKLGMLGVFGLGMLAVVVTACSTPVEAPSESTGQAQTIAQTTDCSAPTADLSQCLGNIFSSFLPVGVPLPDGYSPLPSQFGQAMVDCFVGNPGLTWQARLQACGASVCANPPFNGTPPCIANNLANVIATCSPAAATAFAQIALPNTIYALTCGAGRFGNCSQETTCRKCYACASDSIGQERTSILTVCMAKPGGYFSQPHSGGLPAYYDSDTSVACPY